VSSPKWEVPEPTPEQYARCLMFHSKEEAQAFVAELRELRAMPEQVRRLVSALESTSPYTGEEALVALAHLDSCNAATDLRKAATEEGKTSQDEHIKRLKIENKKLRAELTELKENNFIK